MRTGIIVMEDDPFLLTKKTHSLEWNPPRQKWENHFLQQ